MLRLVLGAQIVVLLSAGMANADCQSPGYQIVNDFINYQMGEGIVYLTILPSDTTVEKLLCLAETLNNRLHPKDALALIFNSPTAAAAFDPSAMNLERGDYRGDLRAEIDLKEGKRELRITPIGMAYPYFVPTVKGDAVMGDAVYDSRFPLPLSGTPHCRLELDGRCVLALKPLFYPADLAKTGIAGEVTATVTLDRTGQHIRIGVVPDAHNRLMPVVIENLTTWRLEPANRETTFRVTFAYILDPAYAGAYPEVSFALPDRVTIRARKP